MSLLAQRFLDQSKLKMREKIILRALNMQLSPEYVDGVYVQSDLRV